MDAFAPWLKTWFTLGVKIPPGHGPQVKSSMFPFTEWVCRVYPLIDSQPRNVAVVGRLALVASKAEMHFTWVLPTKGEPERASMLVPLERPTCGPPHPPALEQPLCRTS